MPSICITSGFVLELVNIEGQLQILGCMCDLFPGFKVVKPWENGSLELSSTCSVALPSTSELTFLNWVTLRYVRMCLAQFMWSYILKPLFPSIVALVYLHDPYVLHYGHSVHV